MTANLVENILGEPGFGSVVVCERMNNGDCLPLSTSAQEKLRGFKEMEEEEPTDEPGEMSEGKDWESYQITHMKNVKQPMV